jgi:hypothetical protein
MTGHPLAPPDSDQLGGAAEVPQRRACVQGASAWLGALQHPRRHALESSSEGCSLWRVAEHAPRRRVDGAAAV